MRLLLCLALLSFALAACSPTAIVLRNPKTGEIVECKSDLPLLLSVMGDVEKCAADYRQSGFVQQTP